MSDSFLTRIFKTFPWQKILTHSYSRVVLRVLEKAVAEKKRFSVYVTESQPDSAGWVSRVTKCGLVFTLKGNTPAESQLFSVFVQATDGRSSQKTQRPCNRGVGCSCGVNKNVSDQDFIMKVALSALTQFTCHVHSYVLEKVDLVIVGAEGVVESGGIINKVCFRKKSGAWFKLLFLFFYLGVIWMW